MVYLDWITVEQAAMYHELIHECKQKKFYHLFISFMHLITLTVCATNILLAISVVQYNIKVYAGAPYTNLDKWWQNAILYVISSALIGGLMSTQFRLTTYETRNEAPSFNYKQLAASAMVMYFGSIAVIASSGVNKIEASVPLLCLGCISFFISCFIQRAYCYMMTYSRDRINYCLNNLSRIITEYEWYIDNRFATEEERTRELVTPNLVKDILVEKLQKKKIM